MTTTRLRDVARVPLTVASVPSGHVYVRHLSREPGDPDGVGPRRLPDPSPDGAPRAASQQWWPPLMLDPAWVRSNHHTFEVFHLHFGFDARSPEDLVELVGALREARKPLVLTVHDLRNPHHPTREAHDAHLDVLVPAADAIITLTTGASAEIRARWGREARVIPHPHVIPLDTMRDLAARRAARPRASSEAFRVGLHVKSLRPGMAPHRVLPALVETVRGLDGAVLQVNAHRDVMDPDSGRLDRELAATLRAHEAAGDLELQVHDYLSDDDLWTYLAGLDVSVLPYRFGTHSGWLEACRDAGTAVVAPSCGYYADQGPVLGYRQDEDVYDPASLVAAVREAHALGADGRAALGTSVEGRRAQRRRIAAGHDELYAGLTR